MEGGFMRPASRETILTLCKSMAALMIFFVAVIAGGDAHAAAGWIGPTGAPPMSNVPAPLNEGTHFGGGISDLINSNIIGTYNNLKINIAPCANGQVLTWDAGGASGHVVCANPTADIPLLNVLNSGADAGGYGGGVIIGSTTAAWMNLGGAFSASWIHATSSGNNSIMGDLGIGTAAPSVKLEVIGDIKSSGNIAASGNVSAPQLCIGADCRSSWPVAGGGGGIDSLWATSTLNINNIHNKNTGNVGIGTNAPASLLHVYGDSAGIRLQRTNATLEPFILLYKNSALTDGGQLRGLISGSGLRFTDALAATEWMRIANGNVGIGTAAPGAYKLNVAGDLIVSGSSNDLYVNAIYGRDGTAEDIWLGDNNDTIQIQNNINIANKATVGAFQMAAGAASGKVLTSDADGLASWQTPVLGGGGGGTDSFWATSTNINNIYSKNSGNVGIGTTNPGAKLEVIGNASSTKFCLGGSCISAWSDPGVGAAGYWAASGNDIYNNNSGKVFVRTNGAGNAELDIEKTTGDGNYWGIYNDKASNTNDLRFWNTNVPGDHNALTLKTSGALGIGSTVPAPGVKLDVNGGIKIAASGGSETAGTVSYSNGDFWGLNGNGWRSLTTNEFKGLTSNMTGSQVGYTGANGKCLAAFPTVGGVHVCTGAEILNIINSGKAASFSSVYGQAARISNGPLGSINTMGNDCAGWSSSNGSDVSVFWSFSVTGGSAGITYCDQTIPFACCI